LTGAHHVLNSGSIAGRQFRAILHDRSLGSFAVDVNKRFAQNPAVSMVALESSWNELLKILVHPHHYLHRTKRTSLDNADRLYIADGHTLQVHRLPRAYTLCIIKVCDESDFLGEKGHRSR